MNEDCDAGCDNKYCLIYDNLDYQTPIITYGNVDYDEIRYSVQTEEFNGTVFAADNFNCPYNGSVSSNDSSLTIDYAACNESAAESPFVDPNVPKNTYSLCPSEWIGDAFCDDTCNTADCGMDGGDCDSYCDDDTCSIFYQVWRAFAGDQHVMNHSHACGAMWSTVLAYFQVEDPKDCLSRVDALDYNQDGFLNFREGTVLGMDAMNNFEVDLKGPQVNCSECVGMEYYNIAAS